MTLNLAEIAARIIDKLDPLVDERFGDLIIGDALRETYTEGIAADDWERAVCAKLGSLTLPTPPARRTLNIADLIRDARGHEARIFAAMGIAWPPPAKQHHIECPFVDHRDTHPSWRWDAHHRRFMCICKDPKTGKQHGDIADIVRRCQPDGVDGSIASVAKWLRAAINRPVEAEPVARAAAGSQDRAKEAERQAQAEAAAIEARRLLANSKPPQLCHPYIAKKQIVPYGARQLDNMLIIPVRNWDGDVRSVQRIWWNARKQKMVKAYLEESIIDDCFHLIGRQANKILFCEGWATACSIHQACDLPTIATLSDRKMASIAKLFRERRPRAQFVFCADNDVPGITACDTAAAETGKAHVVIAAGGGEKFDFNDVHRVYGLAEVQRQILNPFS